jgi:hypothetical protein
MQVSGNVDPQTLELFSNLPILFGLNNNKKPGFGDSVMRRLVVTHASVEKKGEEPLKQEGRVVCELVVTDGTYMSSLRRLVIITGEIFQICSMAVIPLNRRFISVLTPTSFDKKVETYTEGARHLSLTCASPAPRNKIH